MRIKWKISALVSTMVMCSVFCCIAIKEVMALDFQNETDLQFTFEPTITVGIIGGGLSIGYLSPGQSADSNLVMVTAGSNDMSGYTLYANVGDSSHSYTDLRITSSDTTNVFEAAAAEDLESFESGKWGYAYSTDDGASWGYGNTGSATATAGGYGALPLFNSSTHSGDVILVDVNDTSSSVIKFKIGAKAADDQISGTYSNVINFIGVTKIATTSYTLNYNTNGTSITNMPATPVYGTIDSTKPLATLEDKIPVRSGYIFKGWCDAIPSGTTCSGTMTQPGRIYKISTASASATINMYAVWEEKNYIQDMTLAKCQVNVGTNGNATGIGDIITVYDRRDENDYTVRFINNECWMTQNLRITGVVSATDSNFTGSDFDVSEYDLKTNGTSGGKCNNVNGYTNVCSHVPDVTDLTAIGNGATIKSVGVWYNYCAASAGTICASSDATAATSDICPSDWHLPTGPNTTANTDLAKLFGNNTGDYQAATDSLLAFDAVAGRMYSDGEIGGGSGYGFWWTSSAQSKTGRYRLAYNAINGQFQGDNPGYFRHYGQTVRCVRSS